jgi:CheY-like chemotaxis protein
MAGEKILLVEDNEVNRRLAEFLLRSQGYQVLQATTAQEAFAMLDADPPDLILMDIQLAGISGLDVAKQLKENPATCHIPVLAVTSYAMMGDREKALQAGCVGYITKPIDKGTLLKEVAGGLAARARNTPP